MLKQAAVLLAVSFALAACASDDQPKIVQATSNMPAVRLTGGMATQIELPAGRVQMVTVGNPNLLTADRTDNIVNLMPKDGASGDTNIIVRETDDDGHAKVYQYRVTVQAP